MTTAAVAQWLDDCGRADMAEQVRVRDSEAEQWRAAYQRAMVIMERITKEIENDT